MGGPFRILKMRIIMRFIVQIILSLHTVKKKKKFIYFTILFDLGSWAKHIAVDCLFSLNHWFSIADAWPTASRFIVVYFLLR